MNDLAPAATPAPVPVEDAVSFKQQKDTKLYAERVRIYAKAIKGRFRQIKTAALVGLLAIYYLVPWLRWDRGPGAPDQAVLIDMPSRRAYFFWIEIWPQEIYYLTFLLMLGAFGLFLVTSIGGRVWCGFTCPQTVWTDLFMWVERLIEGDRAARIRLDKSPLTGGKVARKVAKHGAWLLIAAATGGAWIMYFNDAPTVTWNILTGQASFAVYFFCGLFTATTYLLAGWAREQVCTYMCPWPRFQAALLDNESYVVTYESWRGEPRGAHKKGASWDGRGDCVACNQCVAVCPTGIDIRDGLQLECIGCGLCIDACNDVMAKVGRPANLITLDTEANQQRRQRGEAPVMRIVRPRTIIYAVIIAVLGVGILLGLSTRATLDVNVLHDRNPLFVRLSDGGLRNGYTLKILNKDRVAKTFALGIEDLAGATLSVIGHEPAPGQPILLEGRPDTVTSYRLYVTAPAAAVASHQQPIQLSLTDQADQTVARFETVFRGPER